MKHTNKALVAIIVGLSLIVILTVLISFNPITGISCALLLLILVLVVPRPILIVYGLTLIVPLTGGLARGSVVPFLRLGQLLLVVGFILFLLARSSPLGKSRLTVIDLAFVLFFLAEAVFPILALYYRGDNLNLNSTNNVYGTSPLQTLLGPLQYYLLYRIVVATVHSEKQIITILRLSFVASIVVSVVGILEKAIPSFGTFIELYYPPISLNYTIPDTQVRVASTLQHYSGLAAYLVFMIIIALVCWVARKRLRVSPLLLATTLLLNGITLILTGTLAGWVGLAVGVVVISLLLRRIPKIGILALVGFVLAVIVFPAFISTRLNAELGAGAIQGFLPQSLAFRVNLWQEIFLPAVEQHLFLGSGPAPAALNNWPAEDSQYLYLLLRGGLLYFFSYFLLIGLAIAICWRQIKRKSESVNRLVSISLLAILVTINVMNISGAYFTYVGGTQILWMLLAMVVASEQFSTQEPSPACKASVDGQRQVTHQMNISFSDAAGIRSTTALERY